MTLKKGEPVATNKQYYIHTHIHTYNKQTYIHTYVRTYVHVGSVIT